MHPILMIILITVLVVAFALYMARVRRDSANADDGIHESRIGERLRRLNENKEKYAVMTPDLLAETPDDALLEAVLSGLWAKMEPDLSNAAEVMASQSQGRQRMYALYLVTGDVKQDGFDALKASADAQFIPMAQAALEALGMEGSRALLGDALHSEDAGAYDDAYVETFTGEAGKEKMTAYIRENAREFCDLA